MAEQPHAATPYFFYEALLRVARGTRERVAVFYCSTDAVDVPRLQDGITSLGSSHLVPDRIVLLGREPSRDALLAAATDPDVSGRVRGATRYAGPPALEVVTFDIDGQLSSWSDTERVPLQGDVAVELMRQGLEMIMAERSVILHATGYHFCKPSNRHSDRFIRTANALRYSSEVSFIAANLLPLLPDREFRAIYTDTSSINSVAYALRDHLAAFGEPKQDCTIDSFSSYSGTQGEFNLEGASAIVLVSASTSGKLNRTLERTTSIPTSRYLTLCYVGKDPIHGVVCDLTDRSEPGADDRNPRLQPPFPSWEPAECLLCQDDNPLIHISGDQFLPADPTVSRAMITTDDAPRWLSACVEQLQGRDVIRCHVGSPNDAEPRSLYLDLEPVVREVGPGHEHESELTRQLERRLERDVPAGTAWIVHLDDPASAALAGKVVDYLARECRAIDSDHVVSQSTLVQMEQGSMPGLVLVVASAVVSGRSILNVSQALRSTHGDNPIGYLIVAARTEHASKTRDIRSNLAFGNGRPAEHAVSVLLDMQLPDDRQGSSSPWSIELQLWKGLRDLTDGERQPDRSAWLEARIAELTIAATPGERGLADRLFLRNHDGRESLQLQPNFAFWKFNYEPRYVTQSEVFFTIVAILHHMRGDRRRLVSMSNEHNQSVLHPAVFARFNDAVIQSALLRAALPHELDYAAHREYSRDVTEVLIPILQGWPTEGEAAAEILLALTTRRLKVNESDLRLLVAALGDEELPEPMGTLADVLRSMC